MKKNGKKLLLTLLFTLMISLPHTVNAATANVNIGASKAKPVVGNTISVTFRISSSSALGSWQYQISYPTSLFTFNSCSANSLTQLGYVSNNTTKSASVTCYFTAKKSGSGSFSIKNYGIYGFNEKKMSVSISPAYVTVITQQQLEASYSKNNNLKSLSVSGGTLNPKFNKNTTTYNVELAPETASAKISGAVEDSRSSVAGLGNKTLKTGINTFKVVVTAENGSTKTYTINIMVKELEPIIVNQDGETYNVVRSSSISKQSPSKFFEPKTIIIEEKEVPAFFNETLNYTLVALQDSEGNIDFYIYNEEENSYKKYQEYSFNQLTLEIEPSKENIPENYKEVSLEILDNTVTAYKLTDDSEFALFNATDIQTGEQALYLYDSVQNTVQRYYNADLLLKTEEQKEQKQIYEYIILGLIGALALTYFILLIALITKERKRKKIQQRLKEEKIEHNKKEELEKKQKQEQEQKQEKEPENENLEEEHKKKEKKKEEKGEKETKKKKKEKKK